MALLSEQDRQTVRGHLAVIDEPVRLLFFTQTFGAPETVAIAKQVLDEIVCLNDQVDARRSELRPRAGPRPAVRRRADPDDRAAERRSGHADPLSRRAGRLRVHVVDRGGHPGGHQRLWPDAGQPGAGRRARDDPARHSGVRHTDVPALPACGDPGASIGSRESAHHASCVEATEFMDLSRRFRVTGVPKTIVNGSIEILGALPEDQFVRTVVGASERSRRRRLLAHRPGRATSCFRFAPS